MIINLPGSLKAVKESLDIIIDPLKHGLEILKGEAHDLLEMMVDLSPLYISLKTAIITIIITFFFGLFLAN